MSKRSELVELKRRYDAVKDRYLDPKTLPIAQFMKGSPRLSRLGLSDAFFVLAAHWPAFIGPTLGPVSYPVSLKKGELRVRVNSPLLRQELTYAIPSFMKVAEDHLGKGVVLSVKAVL